MPNSINWLDSTRRSLESKFASREEFSRGNPAQSARSVTERLTELLFERLPSEISNELFTLLPEDTRADFLKLRSSAESSEETSIGYTEFIDRVQKTIGNPDEALSREVADYYLWAIVNEVHADLKSRLDECLPTELKTRMNLRTVGSDEGSKVA